MLPIEDISSAQHITLKAGNTSFANASAMYTYLLTQHKKVSLCASEDIENNFSFLPWYDKLRKSIPSSTDLIIEISSDTIGYVHYLDAHSVKINKKMATALYAGLLKKYENLQSLQLDGMVFATVNRLIELQAEYQLCQSFLAYNVPLSVFRLKATLFKKMLLVDEASVVNVYICDEDFKTTGATLKDARNIMKELLTLVNVRKVVLIKSDEENKIIQEEIRFEK